MKALDLDNSLTNQLEKILEENIQELAYELSNLKNLFDLSAQELETAKVDLQKLEEKETGISPGQACVFYSKNELGDKVLGGGWIVKAENNFLST